MKLTIDNLESKNEGSYFTILAILALIAWLGIAVSIVGIFYAAAVALFIWIGNGLMVASIKANSVEAGAGQFPELYKIYKEVASQLGAVELPRLYILQAEGALNAFATRHSGRDFVVIYSSIYESLGADSDEMRFLIGHEFGHVIKRHINKAIFLLPVSWLPLIGSAYSRAVEETCDRFGTFAARSTTSAARAMTILAAGKDPGKTANIEQFAAQYRKDRGLFVSWYELISTYPTLSQRTDHILSSGNAIYPSRANRHPLSFPCALLLNGKVIIVLIAAIYIGAIGLAIKERSAKYDASEATLESSDHEIDLSHEAQADSYDSEDAGE